MVIKPNRFLNCREWRTFLVAVAVAYPGVMAAVQASQAKVSGYAAKTYGRLLIQGALAEGALIAGAGKTLGS